MTPSHRAPAPVSFKAAFCECFGCPAEAFQETLLWKCLDIHLRPVASLVRRLSPAFFRQDLEYLGRVGKATTSQELWALANCIPEEPALNHGLLRKGLHLRISGGRLIRTYQQVAEHRRGSFL